MAYHILIIDDVAENIQVAMNILKERNYNFSFATDGEQALDVVSKDTSKVDLILLDIMMPKMDGYELCKHLKTDSRTKDIPIIFLTAKVDIDSFSKGFELGAVDYITKPFHAEELLARVNNHLELSQAKRLLQQNNLSLESEVRFVKQRLLSELEQSQRDMIYLLTELVESTSDETGKHIRRIAQLSALLAHHHPSLNEDDEELLKYSSPMHDIGKMTTPPEILNKPGKLTPEEFEVMKLHAENGYELLKGSRRRIIKTAALIALQHHEKWDGTGYPNQLAQNDIHIYGRIVSLADNFDALTHRRCYKEPWSFEATKEYILEQKGKHFDPQLVDILIENFDEFVAICSD